jgi:hypothetical protein
MRLLIQILALLISSSTFGQYYADLEIQKESLTTWTVTTTKEYEGTYKFGISEGECELRIIICDSIVVAQTSCYSVDTINGGFIDTFMTFTNVRIEDNKFFSDQTNGEFVIYKNEYGIVAGLFVYNPWTFKFNNGGEFGSILPDEGVYLVGNYPFASTRILTEQELEKYTLDQLKVMRNEIYARYGLIFQKGGQMDKHFSGQKWYRRNYDKVDHWLTKIELINIETIKKVEKKKNGL